MKAFAKKLLDRIFGYFVSRFLQAEIEVLRSEHAQLAREIRERAWHEANESSRLARRGPDADPADARVRLSLSPQTVSLLMGQRATVAVTVYHQGPSASSLTVEAKEPLGFGLLASPRAPVPLALGQGEQHQLRWEITAQRPSEVNLGRPWLLEFVARNGSVECGRATLSVHVADPQPGRIYYLLTEDCETFDGGELTGDYHALPELLAMHNRNNFMDPDEYRWQMVEKPNAMNRIADKHGAKWTHFWCVSQFSAAQWAAGQSATGQWPQILALLQDSVRRGCTRHEYAPHIHFGFEPDSKLPPRPRLLYDPQTDGIIPNEFYHPVTNTLHRYHGWDGGRKGFAYVRALGDFSYGDSKTGSLCKACSFLARLQRGHRQPHVARAGACDFGVSSHDQCVSTIAHLRNGLLASADAGYHELRGVYPRERQAYFCRPDDIEREVSDLRQAALVQFKAPSVQLEAVGLDLLTSWFETRMQPLLLPDGRVAPGVHAIVQVTHAMVMKGGSGLLHDTEGGDFAKLDKHLDWIRANHPEVQFATMSEAALEYLDYYAPVLAAVADPASERLSNDGKGLRYNIRLLGATIPVSPERRHVVSIRPPAWVLPEDVESAQVLRDGEEVAAHPGLPMPNASLSFEVERREAAYELVLALRQPIPAARSGERADDAI